MFVAEHRLPILAFSGMRVERNFRLSNYLWYVSSRPVRLSRAMLRVGKGIPSSKVNVSSGQAREYVVCKAKIRNISISITNVLPEPVVPISTFAISFIAYILCAPCIISIIM